MITDFDAETLLIHLEDAFRLRDADRFYFTLGQLRSYIERKHEQLLQAGVAAGADQPGLVG